MKEFAFSPHLYILYVSLGHILDINGTAKNSLQSAQNNNKNVREKNYCNHTVLRKPSRVVSYKMHFIPKQFCNALKTNSVIVGYKMDLVSYCYYQLP